MSELRLEKVFLLSKPLDNWVSDAGGSTARVFQATSIDYHEPVAIKIMSPAWIKYSLPRFIEELRIMCQLNDLRWATHPLEFGFINLDMLPVVDRKNDYWNVPNPSGLKGKIVRIGPPSYERFSLSQNNVQLFLKQLTDYYGIIEGYFNKIGKEKDVDLSDDEWLKVFNLIDRSMPYIVFEKRGTVFLEPVSGSQNPHQVYKRNMEKVFDPALTEVNLLLLCDKYLTLENLMPVNKGLSIAMQICDIMIFAHERNVVFRDHKILHYYWNNLFERVFIIDWNMGQYFPEGVSDSEKRFDVTQFSARALLHILTGHQAEKALEVGRTEYQQLVDAKSKNETYQVGWKNGETKRLGVKLVQVLEEGTSGVYSSFEELKKQLVRMQ